MSDTKPIYSGETPFTLSLSNSLHLFPHSTSSSSSSLSLAPPLQPPSHLPRTLNSASLAHSSLLPNATQPCHSLPSCVLHQRIAHCAPTVRVRHLPLFLLHYNREKNTEERRTAAPLRWWTSVSLVLHTAALVPSCTRASFSC